MFTFTYWCGKYGNNEAEISIESKPRTSFVWARLFLGTVPSTKGNDDYAQTRPGSYTVAESIIFLQFALFVWKNQCMSTYYYQLEDSTRRETALIRTTTTGIAGLGPKTRRSSKISPIRCLQRIGCSCWRCFPLNRHHSLSDTTGPVKRTLAPNLLSSTLMLLRLRMLVSSSVRWHQKGI